jgi:hypothetical protein
VGRYSITVALLLVTSTASNAQRGGRADGLQNYMKSLRPPNPEFVLDFKTVHKKIYLHATDLKRCRVPFLLWWTLGQTRPARTKESRLTSWPPRPRRVPRLKRLNSFGFYHKRIVSEADLGQESKPIIADTVNGKRLDGYTPFCFVAKTKQGETVVVRNVTSIKFRSDSTKN